MAIFNFMTMEDYEQMKSSVLVATSKLSYFEEQTLKSNNAVNAFEKSVAKQFRFQSLLFKIFGKTVFFEKNAPKSEVFVTFMDFLKNIPEGKRELFFRRLFAQYGSLKKIALPCLMWLEAFNLNVEKPTYDANVMKVLLMFYEEQLFMVKFSGDTKGANDFNGFNTVKNLGKLSDVDMAWFSKEKGE